MIKRFIEWLISDLSNYNKYSTQQQEEMKYVLTIFLVWLIIIQTRTLNQYFYNDYKRYEKEISEYEYQNKLINAKPN